MVEDYPYPPVIFAGKFADHHALRPGSGLPIDVPGRITRSILPNAIKVVSTARKVGLEFSEDSRQHFDEIVCRFHRWKHQDLAFQREDTRFSQKRKRKAWG